MQVQVEARRLRAGKPLVGRVALTGMDVDTDESGSLSGRWRVLSRETPLLRRLGEPRLATLARIRSGETAAAAAASATNDHNQQDSERARTPPI